MLSDLVEPISDYIFNQTLRYLLALQQAWPLKQAWGTLAYSGGRNATVSCGLKVATTTYPQPQSNSMFTIDNIDKHYDLN